jgi:hypothetical protein
MTIDNFLNIITGALMAIRTWKYFNYLLFLANKPSVGFMEYLSADKNIVINYFKILPILKLNNEDPIRKMQTDINVIVYLIYILIILEIIF